MITKPAVCMVRESALSWKTGRLKKKKKPGKEKFLAKMAVVGR